MRFLQNFRRSVPKPHARWLRPTGILPLLLALLSPVAAHAFETFVDENSVIYELYDDEYIYDEETGEEI